MNGDSGMVRVVTQPLMRRVCLLLRLQCRIRCSGAADEADHREAAVRRGGPAGVLRQAGVGHRADGSLRGRRRGALRQWPLWPDACRSAHCNAVTQHSHQLVRWCLISSCVRQQPLPSQDPPRIASTLKVLLDSSNLGMHRRGGDKGTVPSAASWQTLSTQCRWSAERTWRSSSIRMCR